MLTEWPWRAVAYLLSEVAIGASAAAVIAVLATAGVVVLPVLVGADCPWRPRCPVLRSRGSNGGSSVWSTSIRHQARTSDPRTPADAWNLVTDAHLAALATEHGTSICTLDMSYTRDQEEPIYD